MAPDQARALLKPGSLVCRRRPNQLPNRDRGYGRSANAVGPVSRQQGQSGQGQSFKAGGGAIPDLAGLPVASAEQTLVQGLKIGLDTNFSDTVPAGHVIGSNPKNEPQLPGAIVELVISSGASAKVPRPAA